MTSLRTAASRRIDWEREELVWVKHSRQRLLDASLSVSVVVRARLDFQLLVQYEVKIKGQTGKCFCNYECRLKWVMLLLYLKVSYKLLPFNELIIKFN